MYFITRILKLRERKECLHLHLTTGDIMMSPGSKRYHLSTQKSPRYVTSYVSSSGF